MYWLFDYNCFRVRDKCGDWGDILPIISQVSNLLISLTYFLIPIFLLWLFKARRKILPASHILIWFGFFILCCGLTHICDFLAFTLPMYRFFTLIDILTCIASVGTLIQLPAVFRFILKAPTVEKYEALIKSQRETINELTIVSESLKEQEQEREKEIKILERELIALKGGATTEEVLDSLLKELAIINDRYRSKNAART